MITKNNFIDGIFKIRNKVDFNTLALYIFRYQAQKNKIYNLYINKLGININNITDIKDIPFLPIEFFKTHKILTGNKTHKIVFTSSGTEGLQTSKHYVNNLKIYEQSFLQGFENFYGNVSQYTILALLPSYLERKGSSLIYMMNFLINKADKQSGFYLNNLNELTQKIKYLKKNGKKIFLIGVSYALINLAEIFSPDLSGCIVMETGGMKGRRREMSKKELHNFLSKKFNIKKIHSEYGMTELLSQAYSQGNGIFKPQPWMKILIRDIYDPFSFVKYNNSGGINVIDLANIYSCSFIETKDLGKLHKNGNFEILGRFDNSDIRGCNLLVQ